MLLNAGTFVLELGTNVIHIAAQCLNRNLAVPRSAAVFDHFSDGVRVTRSISEIGIEVTRRGSENGATVQVEVKPDVPHPVPTGPSQVDDVQKRLGKSGNLNQNAGQIVEDFISVKFPQWRGCSTRPVNS